MITIELSPTELVALLAITEHYRAQLGSMPQTPDVRTLGAVANIVERRLQAHTPEAGNLSSCKRLRHNWAH